MNSRARSPLAAVPKRAAKHSDEALRRYLRKEKMTVTQFGKMGGWSVSSVSRWMHGQFPTTEQQAVIAKITNGQVQPNDWFKGLPNGKFTELTQDEVNRLIAGEGVKVRLNGRYVELILQAKAP